MKIPKTFKLFGEIIDVVFDENLLRNTCHHGETHYRDNEIIIEKNIKKEDAIWSTFWHEFLHTALGKMNEYELSENEKFVSVLSQLIHQVVKDMGK